MIVNIETDNGHMDVNLAEFFPASLEKTRKLFRLMQEGVEPAEQEKVRAYLVDRGKHAEEMTEEEREQIENLQEYAARLDEQIKELKQQLDITRQRIREGNSRVRLLDAVKDRFPVWVREFDGICGREEVLK